MGGIGIKFLPLVAYSVDKSLTAFIGPEFHMSAVVIVSCAQALVVKPFDDLQAQLPNFLWILNAESLSDGFCYLPQTDIIDFCMRGIHVGYLIELRQPTLLRKMYLIERYARDIYIHGRRTTIRHRSKGHIACLSRQLDYSNFAVL